MRKFLLSLVSAASLLAMLGISHAAETLGDGVQFNGHITTTNAAGNPVPTTTTCTLVAGSTDTAGACAATATSGVAVIFGKAFLTAPTCVVLDHTTASGNALATEPTTTTFVLGTTVNADKISWICVGKQGN
jgi:hypothetical protein